MPEKTSRAIEAAKEEAWRRGGLRWKLDSNQQKIYDSILSAKGSFYFNKPRRIGGSYLLAIICIECCLKKDGAQVKYLAPTAKAVRKIVNPNIRKILKDCPKDIRPKFSLLEGEWQFPNGAVLALAGCDNQQFENLRGTEADFVALDEVGFMDDLEYILNDVLMPQVQDTEGKLVLTSTPPRSPAHESHKIAMAHKEAGRYFHCTVWDNPRRTKQQHEAFFGQMAEGKGISLEEFYASTTFRREYLGEFVADEERSVVPEWNQALERHLCTPLAQPKFADKYVSLDIGWRDGMAALFGYWDFRGARLVIQDEYLSFKQTAQQVAGAVRSKELELWIDEDGKPEKPYLRIADNNLQTIADLNQHGVLFIPTKKDDKELQVNNLREWIRGYKIFIHPRCKRLISQLSSTVWNKQRNSYERNSEGHGDLLDALVYLVRNVRRDRNPWPARYGLPKEGLEYLIIDDSSQQSSTFEKKLTAFFDTGISNE